ncbi:MAG: hypothetical protein Q9198_009813, partial [Flavoplaca austrocitrina]
SGLRVAIVHARWNSPIVSALITGVWKALLHSGVKRENIVVQDVPGSYELPYAVQRYSCSPSPGQRPTARIAFLTERYRPSATDLLTSTSVTDLQATPRPARSTTAAEALTTPFDAMVAVGVLIKGETMHFEYIADATSHGLMRVQLDCGVPVVFGLLTVLSEEQAMARAGMKDGSHCHGEDWGAAAVELGLKRRSWARGKMT